MAAGIQRSRTNTKKKQRSFRFKMATSHSSGIFAPDDAVQVHVPGGRGGSCFVANTYGMDLAQTILGLYWAELKGNIEPRYILDF